MRVSRDTGVTVTGTLSGERVGMTIDQNALAHIMSVLTDLYSDPAMAVIREYSTNAFDAHIEAGVSLPIEVTLPSKLSPYFKIRDYGVGLDAEGIRNIYSRYGASTKRDTDDQVGMLGLGCKSALTYTSQFTLVGITNGIKTQVSVSRDEDGTGSMTIVDESPTTESDGVEVIIPARDAWALTQKASYFFKFWPQGSVLVNGEEPERIDGVWISDDLVLVNDGDVTHHTIVMGNVPYPVVGSQIDVGDWHAVYFVPIGAVNFTPSREALQYTKLTKATMEEMAERVREGKLAAAQAYIDEAATHPEALVRDKSITYLGYGQRNLTYKGEALPNHYPEERKQDNPTMYMFSVEPRYRTNYVSEERYLPASQFSSVVWIYGYDGPKPTPTKIAKLRLWAGNRGLTSGSFVLVNEKPDFKWIDPSTVHPWEPISTLKLPPRGGSEPNDRIPGSYDVYEKLPGIDGMTQHYGIPGDDVDTGVPLFYAEKYEYSYCHAVLSRLLPAYRVVILSSNRIAKFKRLFPQATKMTDEGERLFEEWKKGVTKAELLAFSLSKSGDKDYLKTLDPTRIDDPEFIEYVVAAKTDISKLWEMATLFARNIGKQLDTSKHKPFAKYPLAERGMYDRLHREHVYLYISAVYAAEKEKN